jgi:hypothetical protein
VVDFICGGWLKVFVEEFHKAFLDLAPVALHGFAGGDVERYFSAVDVCDVDVWKQHEDVGIVQELLFGFSLGGCFAWHNFPLVSVSSF